MTITELDSSWRDRPTAERAYERDGISPELARAFDAIDADERKHQNKLRADGTTR